MAVNFILAFVIGVIAGGSPCILLLLSTFGTSLILVEEKSQFIKISLGLILGIIFAYILITILFIYFLQVFAVFFIFELIFAIILIIIGSWQIIECKKEKSIIFGTPEKVKSVLKDFIERRSGFYAFLVGIIFVIIKIPCSGGAYLVLIAETYTDPLFYLYIIVFMIGMLVPVIFVLVLLRMGIESGKVDDFRKRNRTKLRLLSGALLIFLAFYLLILDDLLMSIG